MEESVKLTAASMKRSVTVILLLCVCLVNAAKTLDVEKDVSKLSEANVKFSINLYKEIIGKKDVENVMFSPVSISAAMAMVHLGAKGETAKQIDDAFMFSSIENGKFHSAFGELHGLMFEKKSDNVTLKSSNRVFANKKFQILEDYKNALTVYEAKLDQLDFSNAAATVKAINTWVEETTEGKLKDLVNEDSLGVDTALLVANTVYFKGNWHSKFNKEQTEKRAFYVSHYKVVETPFMFQRGKFRFAFIESLTLQIVELKYADKDFSMVIFLPENFDLMTVEKELNYENLTSWLDALEYRDIDLTIPKFKLEESLQLQKILPKMGVVDVFNRGTSDLSGISTQFDGLFVDQVMHKAALEVDEEGSVAAAATTVRLMARSLNARPRIVADHPFLWAIRHDSSGLIIFMGKLVRPSGPIVARDRVEL